MSRSRGDLPKTVRNRLYPYQVVLLLTDWHRRNLLAYIEDRARLGGYRLGSSVQHDLVLFHVDHFPTRAAQLEFIALWGGVAHEPADKESKPWLNYFDADRGPVVNRCVSVAAASESQWAPQCEALPRSA